MSHVRRTYISRRRHRILIGEEYPCVARFTESLRLYLACSAATKIPQCGIYLGHPREPLRFHEQDLLLKTIIYEYMEDKQCLNKIIYTY
jgi:hypothetical protein